MSAKELPRLVEVECPSTDAVALDDDIEVGLLGCVGPCIEQQAADGPVAMARRRSSRKSGAGTDSPSEPSACPTADLHRLAVVLRVDYERAAAADRSVTSVRIRAAADRRERSFVEVPRNRWARPATTPGGGARSTRARTARTARFMLLVGHPRGELRGSRVFGRKESADDQLADSEQQPVGGVGAVEGECIPTDRCRCDQRDRVEVGQQSAQSASLRDA